MNKRFWISAAVLLGTFCLLFSAFALAGGALFLRDGGLFDRSGVGELVTTLESEVGQPPVGTPGAALPTPPGEDPAALSSEVRSAMEGIEGQVSALRGLTIDEDVTRAVLTPAQLRDRVVNEFFEDYTPEEMQDDLQVLSAFGLLEADFDLYQLYVDLYSEQIAGYYDDETQSMYVIQDEAFRGPERMTYAHEYVHALQDQAFGLRDGLNLYDEYCEEQTEYCGAVSALVEGDASLSEQLWLIQYASDQDRREIQDFYDDYQSPVYDAAPEFLRQDFLFPYQQGLGFVQMLYEEGGWPAVDEAYRQPPVTTEQILHPERYPTDEPVEVTLPELPAVLGEGWRELDANVLGEWYTYLVLAAGRDPGARLSDEQARSAAEGWGGDRYAVAFNDQTGRRVLAMDTRWDTTGDADQFWQAFADYGSARWGRPAESSEERLAWDAAGDGAVLAQRSGDAVRWVIAPDEATADQVLGALP
ncbi:MAG TPA: hypothetical protein VFF68_07210 [Anaerolineaceae bacterium]|nr:hypothetical protein [Anaerolineaceae bacterium]